MPAWGDGTGFGGVKIVNVTPGNAQRNLAAVTASYLLFNEVTGEHMALIDGAELTARRTAAVAAIAADRLAHKDASRLLICGSGRIATEIAYTFAAVRTLAHVWVYSPTQANAQKLVARLEKDGFAAKAVNAPHDVMADADMIACATLSETPLIKGDALRGGQFVALIGGFTPSMREADDAAIMRSDLWVDTMTACEEAGDLSVPLGLGLIQKSAIRGDLRALCQQKSVPDAARPRIFKSVGEAGQDLCAARLLAV
jgi:ornithine cyclodeaminase